MADDFIYVPIDFKRRTHLQRCKGYAWVNLITEQHRQHFVKVFDGWQCGYSSEKVLEVIASDTQGLEALIARFQNSEVMGDAVPDTYKPALFNGKRQVPFPLMRPSPQV